MNEHPRISVIIPCYQSEETIEQTLWDIFNQTYGKIEIIAVNDGSDDSTTNILNEYIGRIKIIDQENLGASAARNKGFKESQGEYILFCDADIRLKPTMIEKMLKKLTENPEKAYCYSSFKFGLHTFDLFEFDGEKLQKENYISTMSLIGRNSFIGFDEKLQRYQDWDLWKRMLSKGYEGIWYPERLFYGPMRLSGISKISFSKYLTLLLRKLKIGK